MDGWITCHVHGEQPCLKKNGLIMCPVCDLTRAEKKIGRHGIGGYCCFNHPLTETDENGVCPVCEIARVEKKSGRFNVKEADGAKKLDLSLVPPASLIGEAEALAFGLTRPGRTPYNWRGSITRRRTYLAAALRHITADLDGEDNDPESRLLHLKHAKASLGILLDAIANGTCEDDRPPRKDRQNG